MSQFSLCFLRNIELASDVTTNKFKCSGAWCFINYIISVVTILQKDTKWISFPSVFSICTLKIIKTIFLELLHQTDIIILMNTNISPNHTNYISAAHKKLQMIVVDPTEVHVVFDIPSVFWTVTFEVLQFLRNRHL